MKTMEDTDESLISRHARGDAAAFEMLYRRHELRTWRYLERYVGNRATADDVMHEVWLSVARDSSQYQPTARFMSWLFSIAHNRVLEATRTAPPRDPASTALVQAIGQLPREQREAFLLQIEGELSVEEISAITNSGIEMTQARLHYARTKLGELLDE